MFTIEHEFDSTIITLVDEAEKDREEDVRIVLKEDGADIEQADEEGGVVRRVALSVNQLRDLAASIELPEGAYAQGE